MSANASRYEPRSDPPGVVTPGLWGAWDLKLQEWSDTPRGPRIFTSEAGALEWIAREDAEAQRRQAGSQVPS